MLAPDVRYAYYSHDYAHDRVTDTSGVNPALTAASGASGNLNVLAPIAFSSKDYGNDATVDLAPTMRAMNHSSSHANGGGQLAVVVHGTQDPCTSDIAFALGRNSGQENAVCITGDITHTLKAEGFDASEDGTGRGQPIVAFQNRFRGDDGRGYGRAPQSSIDQVGTLETVKQWNVSTGMAVRRLTPRECERLQGFHDNYTLIPIRKGMAADGPRYKALGNSWAIPNVRWIGARIDKALRALES